MRTFFELLGSRLRYMLKPLYRLGYKVAICSVSMGTRLLSTDRAGKPRPGGIVVCIWCVWDGVVCMVWDRGIEGGGC